MQRSNDKRNFVSDGTTTRPFENHQVIPATAGKRDFEMKPLLQGLSELTPAPGIAITDIMYPSDARARNPECCIAIAREIKGLLERDVFRIVHRKDLPPNTNVINLRFVLPIKNVNNAQKKFKARRSSMGIATATAITYLIILLP